eukprot:10821375-Ditylum_brightwellii.AAC.1
MRFCCCLGDELYEENYHDSTGESNKCGRPSIGEVKIKDIMAKTVEICMSNGVKMKQDEIENGVKNVASFFSEEQCWEDAYSDKGVMGIASSWIKTYVG